MALTRLSAIDRWTLLYAATASIALGRRLDDGIPLVWLLVAGHALLLVLPFVAAAAREAGPFGRFVALWYPIVILMSLYTEVGLINLAGGEVFDHVVQSWEASLFGGQPSRAWIQAQPWPWLSWPMHLGYLSYYVIIVGAPFGLWISRRSDAARHTILLTMVTFYLCYIVFLFFPVAGPRYGFALADNAATEVLPAVLTQQMLNAADAWGAAFPSSHVAAALVAAVSAVHGSRVLGLVLVPLAVLLTFGTVYGQFHYAVDVIAGLVLAAGVLIVGLRHRSRATSEPRQPKRI